MYKGARVVGYVRLSKAAEGGYSLAAQEKSIRDACEYRGWELLRVESDPGASGKSLKRPGLMRAIAACKAGETSGVVCAKLDRISRSVGDFANLAGRSQKDGWALIVLEPEIDLSSPYGEAVANILMTFAQLERRMISARTKAALNEARSQGMRLGRPPVTSSILRAKVRSVYERVGSLRRTARELNDTGMASPLGKRWHPNSVRRCL